MTGIDHRGQEDRPSLSGPSSRTVFGPEVAPRRTSKGQRWSYSGVSETVARTETPDGLSTLRKESSVSVSSVTTKPRFNIEETVVL